MSALQCQAMMDQLLEFAPRLHPRICPKGYEDEGLFLFCKTEEQKQQYTTSFQEFEKKTSQCSICKTQKNGNTFQLISTWNISFSDGIYQLKGLQFCCDLCSKVQYFTNQIYNPEDQVIKHFFKTNHIEIDNISNSVVTIKERSLYQQWFSLCYSLQMFAGYAELQVVDNMKHKFSEKTNISDIFHQLLIPSDVPKILTTKRKSPLKRNKKKEQPKKKFKKN